MSSLNKRSGKQAACYRVRLSTFSTRQCPIAPPFDWSFIENYLSDNPNREVVTPLYTDPKTGDLGAWMLSKLYSNTDDVSAVIVAHQSPDMLFGSLARLSLSAGQSIAILDESMMLMARLPVEEELRNALAENQLVLYYQPQIRNPNQLVGYEVLLRWRHLKRGIVSPGVFIPIAEQSRLIQPIGRWIIEHACEKLAAWQSEPANAGLSLAVNVSIVQFQSNNFVDHVGRILEKTGAPPHLLKLEVTESLLMDDPERITEMINQLRLMGVRFSPDDFGTGYSSMSYLNQFPLDQIKINQSFIHELTTSLASSAIVEFIIGLAKGLNLEVIAEGVETEEQKDWLTDHGCHEFSGVLVWPAGRDLCVGTSKSSTLGGKQRSGLVFLVYPLVFFHYSHLLGV